VSGKKYNCPSFKVFHEDGYLVHVSAYLTDTPFPVSISFSPENNAYTVDAHDASNQLLSDPITVYISTENVGVKILTYAGTENLKEGAVLPSSATPGDAVEVKSEVKDGLFFDKVTFSVSSLKEQSTPSFRFVMPNADLTVTFNLKDYGDVVIPATEHLSGYQLYSDSALTQEAKGYHPGADLYVKFTAEEKYQVYALSEDSGKNTVTSVTNNVFKVTVASDFWATLTLTPSLALAYSVTFKTGNHVSFALLDAADSSVCPGKTVKFTAVADHGYRVTSVTEADGKVQISGEGRANTYQFTSIPEDVEITASATDAAQADISFQRIGTKGPTPLNSTIPPGARQELGTA
jgi:peroxiredoxin